MSTVRLVMGGAAFVVPGLLARLTGTSSMSGSRFMARVFATREVALALVTLSAVGEERVPPYIYDANMLVDGFDGLAGLLGRGLPRFTRFVTVTAAAGAVAAVARTRSRLT